MCYNKIKMIIYLEFLKTIQRLDCKGSHLISGSWSEKIEAIYSSNLSWDSYPLPWQIRWLVTVQSRKEISI